MNKKKLIGIIFMSLGIIFLITHRVWTTGNAIVEYPNKVSINFFIFVIFFIGILMFASGNLEDRTREYDGVIILGGNWRGYPYKFKPAVRKGREVLDISLRSKINCTAAGEMYLRGETKKIIINDGKTAGEKWLSEGEAMRDYLLKKYKIKKEDIIFKGEAMETYEEIEGDLKLAKENGLKKVALMTVDTQLPRCKKYLESIGENVDCISSEEEFRKISPHYSKLDERYKRSFGVNYYERFKEYILRVMQNIGITKQFTKILSRVLRGKSKSD